MAEADIRRLPETTLLVTCAAGREGEARRELRAIFPGAEARALFLRGNVIATVPEVTVAQAVEALNAAQTHTIGRCVPVRLQADLRHEDPLTVLQQAALAAADFAPGDTFRVTCDRRGQHSFHSRDVERQVGMYLEAHTPAAFRFEGPDWLVPVEIFQDIAYIGCVHPEHMVHKAITRMRIHAPGQRPLNRAQSKLEEALEAFGVRVDTSTRALDLGAAPGGWTKVLAERGAEVVAVDPAELAPDVAALPRVTHLRGRAEALLGSADLAPFDLIVNDMNTDPRESAAAVRSLLPLLKPGGSVIMTVKFMTARRRIHVREVYDTLRSRFATVREQPMPHNAKETTVLLSAHLAGL
jgi:23S rRNA (cytidine2498-2'-O)-methyltransferase